MKDYYAPWPTHAEPGHLRVDVSADSMMISFVKAAYDSTNGDIVQTFDIDDPLIGWECTPDDTQACDTGEPGECAAGTQTCQPDGTWGSCIRDVDPVPEVCDDPGELDEDCDGYANGADTDCWACTPDDTQACDTGEPGECAAGTQTCQPDGTWGSCIRDVDPVPEVCDDPGELDEDCDGYANASDPDCF